MWLEKRDLGIDNIFTGDAIYIESWGSEYKGVKKIKHWFNEWNTRGNVIKWAENGKINFLKEYGCNIDNYDPYQSSLTPRFKDKEAMWF